MNLEPLTRDELLCIVAKLSDINKPLEVVVTITHEPDNKYIQVISEHQYNGNIIAHISESVMVKKTDTDEFFDEFFDDISDAIISFNSRDIYGNVIYVSLHITDRQWDKISVFLDEVIDEIVTNNTSKTWKIRC